MPLPSDPSYISPAPADVQKRSQLFRTLLRMNTDPYAKDTHQPDMIKMITANLPPAD